MNFSLEKKHDEKVLGFLSILFFVFMIIRSFGVEFDIDELEFIHTSWLISQGQIIYQDFFQHHHPLSYFFSAYFLSFFKESLNSIHLFRIINLGLALLIGGVVYFCGKKFFGRLVGLAAIVFFFSARAVYSAISQIRPDVWMLFCMSLSTFFLLSHLSQKKNFYLSAFFVGLGFLILQKMLFYWLTLNGWMFFCLMRNFSKRELIKSINYNLIVIATVGIGLWLMLDVSWNDYFFLNWKLNTAWSYRKSPWEYLGEVFIVSPVLIISALYGLKNLKKEDFPQSPLWLLTFLTLGTLLSLFVVQTAHRQYYLPFLLHASLLAGIGLKDFLSLGKNPFLIRGVIGLLFLVPLVECLMTMKPTKRAEQIKRIEFVLNQTQPQDYIYDGDIQFNVFSQDIDYFWYSVHPKWGGIYAYQKFREYDYDLLARIKMFQPKIVNDFLITDEIEDYLKSHYKKNDEYGLYIKTNSSP